MYGDALDPDYTRVRLSEYATAGDRYFPELCNYPYYAGLCRRKLSALRSSPRA